MSWNAPRHREDVGSRRASPARSGGAFRNLASPIPLPSVCVCVCVAQPEHLFALPACVMLTAVLVGVWPRVTGAYQREYTGNIDVRSGVQHISSSITVTPSC